jgi:beta-lactam-binding protein with PASTA domain
MVGMPIAVARETIAAMRRNLVGQDTPAANGQEPQLLLLEITREALGSAEGTVVGQTPAPNSPLALRTTIELVVAK